nr:Chain P, Analogue of RT-RH pol protease substrate peptide [synthetic construct]
GAQTFYVDGA